MPRNLTSPMLAAIGSSSFSPCYLLDLQLVSGTDYAWSGIGSVFWNGNTYAGVGSFGSVGDVSESCEANADGTTVGLSGIDSTLLNDTLNDIQQGAPATLWLALFSAGTILTAYPLFGGTVDKPTVGIGPDTLSIALNLETKMANMQRPTNRRYTAADQRNYFPNDSGFSWIEVDCSIALIWG